MIFPNKISLNDMYPTYVFKKISSLCLSSERLVLDSCNSFHDVFVFVAVGTTVSTANEGGGGGGLRYGKPGGGGGYGTAGCTIQI